MFAVTNRHHIRIKCTDEKKVHIRRNDFSVADATYSWNASLFLGISSTNHVQYLLSVDDNVGASWSKHEILIASKELGLPIF